MQFSRSTWIKIGGAVVAIIVAAFVLNSVFALLRTLIPLAALGVLGFFAYRWYAAQQERPQQRPQRQKEKPARQVTVPASTTQEAKPARKKVDDALASWDKAAFVRQVERLAERERELQQAAEQRQKDAVAEQLAERRRRLGLDE